MIYVEKESEVEAKKNEIESFFAKNGFENVKVIVRSGSAKNLAQDCEKIESSFLFIQWTEKQKRQLKAYLKYCRDLRIPYLFFKDEFSEINFEKVLLTVSFLIEDYEKNSVCFGFRAVLWLRHNCFTGKWLRFQSCSHGGKDETDFW